MKFVRLLIGAIALATGASALAQDAVSLRLNWYLGGLHVPFYYGKEMGFFKQEGIDLTINEGRGSANTVQVVAAGSDTFGMADHRVAGRCRAEPRCGPRPTPPAPARRRLPYRGGRPRPWHGLH